MPRTQNYGQAQLVGQPLQFAFPQPHARAVAAATVSGDRQASGVRVALGTDAVPPGADRLHREGGGVMVDTDADPTGIGGEIVDAIRHRPAQFLEGVAARFVQNCTLSGPGLEHRANVP